MAGIIKNKWLVVALVGWSLIMLGTEALGSVTVFGWAGVTLMWAAFVKWGRRSWPILIILGLINLRINELLSIEGWMKFSFNLEKINLTNPAYLKIIERYWHDNLLIPYRIRTIFYGNWMLVFLWIDSALKLLSPIYWIRLWGFSLSLVMGLGVEKILKENKWLIPTLWLSAVVATSALGIMIDTRKSLILALPVVVQLIIYGVKNKRFAKLKWIILMLIIIDGMVKL